MNVTFYSLAEPIEYIPRSKGLGLGAERRPPPGGVGPGRRRKPGDETSNKVFRNVKFSLIIYTIVLGLWDSPIILLYAT